MKQIKKRIDTNYMNEITHAHIIINKSYIHSLIII